MGKQVLIDEDVLKNIAQKIRVKSNKTDKMLPSEMAQEVDDLYYKDRKELFVSLNKDDFSFNEEGAVYFNASTPALEWIKSNEDYAFSVNVSLDDGTVLNYDSNDMLVDFNESEEIEDGIFLHISLYINTEENFAVYVSNRYDILTDSLNDSLNIYIIHTNNQLVDINFDFYKNDSKLLPLEYADTSEIEHVLYDVGEYDDSLELSDNKSIVEDLSYIKNLALSNYEGENDFISCVQDLIYNPYITRGDVILDKGISKLTDVFGDFTISNSSSSIGSSSKIYKYDYVLLNNKKYSRFLNYGISTYSDLYGCYADFSNCSNVEINNYMFYLLRNPTCIIFPEYCKITHYCVLNNSITYPNGATRYPTFERGLYLPKYGDFSSAWIEQNQTNGPEVNVKCPENTSMIYIYLNKLNMSSNTIGELIVNLANVKNDSQKHYLYLGTNNINKFPSEALNILKSKGWNYG